MDGCGCQAVVVLTGMWEERCGDPAGESGYCPDHEWMASPAAQEAQGVREVQGG